MTVYYGNTVNLDALLVPGVTVDVEPPTGAALVGRPSNILGMVGSATWGPVNSPTVFGSPQAGAALFGQPQVRLFDLMTHVLAAALNGATSFKGVRVTDGTDVAATVEVLANCLLLTSYFTGSQGNYSTVSISPGSQVGTWRVVTFIPGATSETFDNIGLGATGNGIWIAIANAINNGVSIQRGPSRIVVATAGSGNSAPATATYTLASGTDGASGVSSAQLLGSDTATPRTGMYSLRNSQASVVDLADCYDSTSWSAQVAYGLSEGSYMIGVGPSGDSIANAVSTLQSAGINSTAFKYMHGDWVYFNDTTTQLNGSVNGLRVVSPQGFVAGFLSAASPNQPSLNQELKGIVGTQKTMDNQVYATADLAQLAQAGIDCITNPSAGGNYYSCFLGHNTSSNPLVQSDSYTTLTNFFAYTLNGPQGLGQFIGDINNPTEQQDAIAAVDAFLQAQWDLGIIGNSANPNTIPFNVSIPASLNTQQQTALGFQYMIVLITYYSIVEKLICFVQGGSSVVVQSASVTQVSPQAA